MNTLNIYDLYHTRKLCVQFHFLYENIYTKPLKMKIQKQKINKSKNKSKLHVNYFINSHNLHFEFIVQHFCKYKSTEWHRFEVYTYRLESEIESKSRKQTQSKRERKEVLIINILQSDSLDSANLQGLTIHIFLSAQRGLIKDNNWAVKI